jgi:hypothetical protein
MWVDVVPIIIVPVVFGSLVAITVSILRFKLKNKELEMRGSDAELGPVVDALRGDVEQLAEMQEHTQAQLAEVQERLDFAERLLTAGRESQDEKSK